MNELTTQGCEREFRAEERAEAQQEKRFDESVRYAPRGEGGAEISLLQLCKDVRGGSMTPDLYYTVPAIKRALAHFDAPDPDYPSASRARTGLNTGEKALASLLRKALDELAGLGYA